MLKDEDRIFTNLYGWMDSGLRGAKVRGDWDGTAKLIKMGHDEIVERVKTWCTARRVPSLMVCPYQGLTERLRQLGFAPLPGGAAGAEDLRFGETPVLGEMCEEAELFALELSG